MSPGKGLAVWDVVDGAFRFTRHHAKDLSLAAGPAIAAMEVLDYSVSVVERLLGLDDPNMPVPWLAWLPLHLFYLVLVTFFLSIASIAIVELVFGTRTHTRSFLRVDRRSLRLWGALFLAWLVTFFVTAGFQIAADLLVTAGMMVDFDIFYAIINSPGYAPAFWALHFVIMVMVLARLSFFAPPVAVVEGQKVFRASAALCRGRFWRVVLVALAVEAPFLLAFLILPLPFHGVLGFGAESVFEDGVLVTAPAIAPLLALLKHVLDGTVGLLETATFTGAAAIAYRALRPELEFE